MLNHKFTPFLLTTKGEILKTLCEVLHIGKNKQKKLTIYKKESNLSWNYQFNQKSWEKKEKPLLSQREREIILLYIQGFDTAEVADICCVSTHTIKYHRKKMYNRFGCSNLAKLINYVVSQHVL